MTLRYDVDEATVADYTTLICHLVQQAFQVFSVPVDLRVSGGMPSRMHPDLRTFAVEVVVPSETFYRDACDVVSRIAYDLALHRGWIVQYDVAVRDA